MRKYIFLLVLTFFSLSLSLFADGDNNRFVVQTSHFSTVNSIKYESNSKFLFTCGDDGKIKIWKTETRELYNQFQATTNRIIDFKLNPVDNEIALLISDDASAFTIEIWNWETQSLMNKTVLQELPLCFDYSGQGNYLVYCTTSMPSVNFINSKTGRTLNYLRNFYGLVSFAYIGSSESTIMTYSSSGILTYLNILSGTPQMRISTEQDLNNIYISSDKKFILATKNNKLLCIDRISGSIVNEKNLPDNYEFISYNNLTDNIVCYSENRIIQYIYSEGAFEDKAFYLDTIPENITTICNGEDAVYLANSFGEIKYYFDNGFLLDFESNNLMTINDIFFTKDYTGIVSNEYLFLYNASIFNSEEALLDPPEPIVIENPLNTNTKVIVPNEDSSIIYLWNNDESRGVILKYDLVNQEIIERFDSFTYSFKDVSINYGLLLTIQSNGQCNAFDLSNLTRIYTYNSVGVESLTAISEYEIVVGRSSTTTPLVYINISTGETIPLSKDNFIIYDIKKSEQDDAVFAMGIKNVNGAPKTVLEMYSGELLGETKTISTFNGEDLNADLFIDQITGEVYTTLGSNGIIKWNRFRTNRFNFRQVPPTRIFCNNNRILSINQDLSLTIWNSQTGSSIIDFYLFKDLSWLALNVQENLFYGSTSADSYLNIYINGESFLGLKDYYRF